MAIIKCPECGHQISDRAPVCPSCGVEIAGKITLCKNCGEAVFKDQATCPNCGEQLKATTPPPVHTTTQPVPPTPKRPSAPQQPAENEQGKSRKTIIIALAISLVICGGIFYFYSLSLIHI